ncbi:hypothetical protein BH20ACT4_BH20ACT4_06930 [soil metagenome]
MAEALSRFARNTRHGLVVHGGDGTITWCNPSAAHLLCTTTDDLLGSRWLGDTAQLTHADGTPLDPAALPSTAALRSGREHAEGVVGLRGPDQEVSRWIEVESHAVNDDHGPSVVSLLIDITDRYGTRSEVAATLRTFQISLQPSSIPSLEGLEVDARCRPASGTLVGGGDFYDVLRIDDMCAAFFLGDMQGHGVGPATETFVARHTLRAAAYHADDPSAALDWLHQALSSSISGRSCTAAFGRVRCSDEGAHVEYSLAGHPQPLLLQRQAPAEFHGIGGTLVGTVEREKSPINSVTLEPGSALAFYTDGLMDSGMPRLHEQELLERVEWRPTASEILDHLMALSATDEGTFSDDTALLVVSLPG